MKLSTFLQLFLLVDIFIMGALAAVALRHGRAHFWLKKQLPAKGHPAQNGHLPPAVREHLLEEAEANFQHVLNSSAKELQQDLDSTAQEIKKLLETHGSQVVASELEQYRTRLAELEKQAENTITGMHTEVADQQNQLKAKLAEEMEAEKQRLVQQLDTKLADAVTSFLLETLQHEVDLGSQTAYLIAQLEEHKAELAKGVKDEV